MTVAIALLAVVVPALLAIRLAARQAQKSTTQRVLSQAEDGLLRSEAAYYEIMGAVDELAATGSADPCSASNLDLMLRHVVRSGYLKAVGYVKDNRLVCSSMGGMGRGLAFAPVPPEWVSPIGTRLRVDVRFPFDPERAYLMVESKGFVALVSSLPVLGEVPGGRIGDPEQSLATFSTFNGRFLARRGYVNPAWFGPIHQTLPKTRQISTFVADDHVVALARSNVAYIATVAALPLSQVRAQTRATALVLLPMMVLAGLLLAWAARYWSQLQTALPAVLRRALRHRELSVRYQPVVDLRTGKWSGAEALLRWRRSTGEVIPPDIFIPAAEGAGLIRQITAHLFELVAGDLQHFCARHPQLHIAVNLSPQDLAGDMEIVAALRKLAARTGMTADKLVVEVSEHGLLEHSATGPVLDEIRAQGFKVAIDDFGTGYSNLAHLEHFRMDYLKIDKIFVASIRRDAPTSSVVPHIVDIARTLGLAVVAEGVETEEQAQFLRELGVQYAQGWLFGRPMSAAEFIRGYSAQRG